jgi:hypothetical protein
MWLYRAHLLLRLVIISLFLGMIPPAASPQAQPYSGVIAGPPAANAAASVTTAQTTPSQPIPSTSVPHPRS